MVNITRMLGKISRELRGDTILLAFSYQQKTVTLENYQDRRQLRNFLFSRQFTTKI